MKKFVHLFFVMLASCTLFLFAACDDGGGGGSSLPMDDRLVGQWEGDIEGDPAIITITGSNKMTLIVMYPDDYVGDDDPGNISGGSKFTLAATAMTEDDISTAEIDESLGGAMTWTPTHEWRESGEELPDSTEIAPVDNWYPYNSDDGNFSYELSDNDTVLTCTTPGGVMTFDKGTAPAPDPKLIGTWRVEDEDMRFDVVLGSNGSFATEIYDISESTPELRETENGTWGVYRSVEGKKYFVVTSTRSRELPDAAVSMYRFSRMDQWLNMFSDPDTFFIYADGEMIFERQGSDPAEPAPDAAVVGYWQKVETEDLIDVDSVTTFYSDNTFIKVQYFQSDHAEKPYEIAGGFRGHYIATGGEMILNISETWYDADWEPEEGVNPDCTYAVDSDILTLAGFFDSPSLQTMEWSSIPEPDVPSELVGTWYMETTEDYDDAGGADAVAYTVEIAANGDFIMTLYDVDDAPFVARVQTGTCGVWNINDGAGPLEEGDFFNMIIDQMDDYPVADPDNPDYSNPFFWASRYPYVYADNGTDPDTFTLGGGMVFEKQPD